MRLFVEGHEEIYYQGDVDQVRNCTSQIHGHLHLEEAIYRLGPPMIYVEYPMERVCGQIKPGAHSRSQVTVNMANSIAEIERFKSLEFSSELPDDFPIDFSKDAEGQNTGKGDRLFELADKYRYISPEYEERTYMLLGPATKRKLQQEELNHLADFNECVGGLNTRAEIIASKVKVKLWGRCLCGEKLYAEAYKEQVRERINE